MTLSNFLFLLSAVFYAAAFGFHWLSFSEIREQGHRQAALMLRLGFLAATFALVLESVQSNLWIPVGNLAQGFSFFAWCLAFVYLVLLARFQSESFGLILNPILFLFTGIAVLISSFTPSEPQHIKTEWMNIYFAIHILSVFFAYASFALSFAAGILFLIQHRELKRKHAGRFYHKLPSLEELDRLIYQPLYWGAPLLLLALVVGFRWSKTAFGAYWLKDPKSIFSSIIAVIYVMILSLRQTSFLRGKKIAVWSIVAFSLLIVGFAGIGLMQGTRHFF